MTFKNKKHAERFFAALADKRIDPDDRGLMAAIYLLTSQKRIWNEFAHFVDSKNGIDPEAFHLYEPKAVITIGKTVSRAAAAGIRNR